MFPLALMCPLNKCVSEIVSPKIFEPSVWSIDEVTIDDVILVTFKDVAFKVVNVPAAAEAPPMVVPSIVPLLTSIFVMFSLFTSNAPPNWEIVIEAIVPPSTASPLIELLGNEIDVAT